MTLATAGSATTRRKGATEMPRTSLKAIKRRAPRKALVYRSAAEWPAWTDRGTWEDGPETERRPLYTEAEDTAAIGEVG